MSTPALNPIVEMGRFIAGSIAYARGKLRWAEVLTLEAAEDIQADVIAQQKALAQAAYSAEQADREAERLLAQVTADGRVDASEMKVLGVVLKHVRRSAEHDHNISERASV